MSQVTLLGCRTKYDGNFVPMTRSIAWPSLSPEVDKPPCRCVAQDLFLRIPLEGEAHDLSEVPAGTKLGNERSDMQLRSAPDERYLGFAYDDRSY